MRRKSFKAGIIACTAFALLSMNTLPVFASSKNLKWYAHDDHFDRGGVYVGAKEDSSCIYVWNPSNARVKVSVKGYHYVNGLYVSRDAGTKNGIKYYETTGLTVPANRECLIYNLIYETNTEYAAIVVSTDSKEDISGYWSPDSVKESGHSYTYIN